MKLALYISHAIFDEFQCRYWKQVWQRHNEDFYIIRQGNSWYKDKISEYKVNKNEN